jgi:cell wall-associated NlpC family hydrolase
MTRRGAIALASVGLAALLGGAPSGEATKRKSAKNAKNARNARQRKQDKQSEKRKSKNKNKKKQGGGSGAEVVRVAKKHKGARYVWGGESPRGFDCSGFTWYCYQQATGMDIGRTVEAQWKEGRSVGKGDWKAGDLVFFKNTFERGLSHDGIYIGGGKFIHAENERTGVVISTLESGYYDDHYAGARRLV